MPRLLRLLPRLLPLSLTLPLYCWLQQAYSYSNSLALVRTSQLLSNASGATYWKARAASVATSLKRVLWHEERGACYDRDATGKIVDVLMHNNIRCMWHGMNYLD